MLGIKQRGLGWDFWWFRGGEFLSELGGCAQALAIAWWVLEVTGSAVSMSVVLMSKLITSLIVAPLLAPLGDRYSRRTLMLWASLILTMVTTGLALLFYLELVNFKLLVFVLIVSACFQSLFGVGSSAVVANLVSKENLQKAYQNIQAIRAVTMILGGTFGASLVVLIGIKGAITVNALSYLASLLGIMMIRKNTTPKRSESSLTPKTWLIDLKKGFEFIFQVRVIWGVILFIGLLNMIIVPLIMLFPFIIKESLGLTPWHVGMVQMAAGIGSITGALSLGLLVRNTSRYMVSILGATLPALCFVVIGWAQSYWPLLVGVSCSTIFTTWLNTLISSRLALVIPDGYRSRTMTAMSIFSSVAVPVGLLITAPLMDYFNSWYVFLGGSLLSTLSLFLFFRIPDIKDFFNQSPEQAQDWFKSIQLEKEQCSGSGRRSCLQ